MLPKFWKSEEGNFAAIFAIAILPIMAGVAGIVDFAIIGKEALKLQENLDATGIAIATKYYPGMTKAEVQQFALAFFKANIDPSHASSPDDASDFEADAVVNGAVIDISVSAKVTHEGFIGGSTTWRATRDSLARLVPGQPACLLALDAHASESVKIQGSTQVRLDGCVIASNSSASDSISKGGSAQLAAECVFTVGGTVGLSGSGSDLDCEQPLELQYPSMDPLAVVDPPVYTGCKSLPGAKKKTLTPGTFCNKTWSGNIMLEPGIYILRGGHIKLGGNGYLIGQGVTIFLTEGAEFVSNTSAFIDLSPATTGPYAGIAIFQERGNTSPLTIDGGLGSQLNGFIYAPNAHVFYAGNSIMSKPGGCLRIVGSTIEMTGNSAISSDCDVELGEKKINAGRQVLLVK